MMRTVVAFTMALVLVSILAVCPLMACPLTAGSGEVGKPCCHKSQTQPASCPRTTVQDCPYFILENSKTAKTASQTFVIGLPPVSPEVSVSDGFSILPAKTRLPNSAGLFLRIRVLLI
jgi:hypothetical protein